MDHGPIQPLVVYLISRHNSNATCLGKKKNLLKTTGYEIKPREGKTSEEKPQLTFETTPNST